MDLRVMLIVLAGTCILQPCWSKTTEFIGPLPSTTPPSEHLTPPYFDLKRNANISDSLRFQFYGTYRITNGQPDPQIRFLVPKVEITFDDGSRLKIAETNNHGSNASEYRITWRLNIVGKNVSYNDHSICVQMNRKNSLDQEDKSYWYSTAYKANQKFPLESPKSLATPKPIPLSTTSNGHDIVEHLYLNSHGFVIVLNDLRPWAMSLIGDKNSVESHGLISHPSLCFQLQPVQWSTQGIEHPEDYFSFDMRIVSAADSLTRTAYLAAVHEFGHLSRPTRVPPKFVQYFHEPVYSFTTLQLSQTSKMSKSIDQIMSMVIDFLSNITDFQKEAGTEVRVELSMEIQPPTQHWFTESGAAALEKNNTASRMGTLFGYDPMFCGRELSDSNKPFILFTPHRLSLLLGPWINYLNYEQISGTSSGAHEEYFLLNKKLCQDFIKTNAFPVDFSVPEAQNWFRNRLNVFQDQTEIDTFRFVHGKVQNFDCNDQLSWSVHNELVRKYPDFMSTLYAVTGMTVTKASIGTVDTPYKAQALGFTVQIDNQGSTWNPIPALLSLSLAGYPLVMPVPYQQMPLKIDLPNTQIQLRRWLQVACLLPGPLQMPILPWTKGIDDKLENLIKDCQLFRKKPANKSKPNQYVSYLQTTIGKWIETGEPVVRPMWWADPYRASAYAEPIDQFMIGDRYLVAPFILQKYNDTERNVDLPAGVWGMSNDTQHKIQGPGRFHIKEDMQKLQYFVKDP